MKRMFSVFLLITVWLLVTPFLQAQSHVDKVLKDEITSDLKENILSFWERYSVDSSGGFYGSLGRDGAPIADAPKGGVLNARILWTFSTAYRMYGDTAYRKLADRAQRYFIDHFIDSQYGGVYWLIKGTVPHWIRTSRLTAALMLSMGCPNISGQRATMKACKKP